MITALPLQRDIAKGPFQEIYIWMNFQWHFSIIPAPYNIVNYLPQFLIYTQGDWLFYFQMTHKSVFLGKTTPLRYRHLANCI